MPLPSRTSFASGASKRKKKKDTEEFIATQAGSLDKFIVKKSRVSDAGTSRTPGQQLNESLSDQSSSDPDDEVAPHDSLFSPSQTLIGDPMSDAELNVEALSPDPQPDQNILDTPLNEMSIENMSDPALWPKKLNTALIQKLVEMGPVRIRKDEDYPADSKNRRFSKNHYVGVKPNGEKSDRRWLLYSWTQNSVYCFPCKIFSPSIISFTEQGMSDWKNVSDRLKMHEHSLRHKESVLKWLEMENRINRGRTIDKELQEQIKAETQQWKSVFQRILRIIQYLAQNNLAFRGSSDTLASKNNGNFLGLVELLAEFDPIMKEHVRKATNREIKDHFLSHMIQNELIGLMAKATKEKILELCKRAKYYSIIADCTRDISRVEQLTITIRFVQTGEKEVHIHEHFIGFSIAETSTGSGLTQHIMDHLTSSGLQIENCRGQGYDNGSNMKGIHQGVQKRILDLNPRAFFVPCACHSLNLVLKDAAESSLIAVNLFTFMQQLYNLFSGSTQRWAILVRHAKSFTVKHLSTTRWEARISCLKAVRYQMPEIYDALQELAETADDNSVRLEAETIGNTMRQYQFLVSLIVWYEVLFQINLVSKRLQNIGCELQSAIQQINASIEFMEKYRNTGFNDAQSTAKDLADLLDVNAVFPQSSTLRVRRKKRLFSYEQEDEPIADPKEKFRIEFFNVIVDQTTSSLNQRFDQLKEHSSIFGFLYNIRSTINLPKCEVQKHCMDLEIALRGNDQISDINAKELADELQALAPNLAANSTAMEALRFICENSYEEYYENTVIALQILMTLPVSVASGERDFSKLKLIKTYLRSVMTQERLSDLALISIENDVCSSLNFDQIINQFAESKARKASLEKL